MSSHPLFPAIAALWFAALFGLCSLAIRPELFESLVQITGIERAIPAAAPPLGMTARVLIALALALAGGLVGIIVARIITAKRESHGGDDAIAHTRTRRPDAPRRRPISAHEELDAELAAEFGASTQPVETIEEQAPSGCFDEVEDEAPLLDIVSVELIGLPEERPVPLFVPETPPEAELEPEPAPESVAVAHPPLGKAAERILGADLSTLSPLELVERLGLAMQRRRAGIPAAPAPALFAQPPAPVQRLHSAPPARVVNEQALRSALANLQRISGAA